MLNDCNAEESYNNLLSFTYNGIDYNIDVKQIAENNNMNIEEYPYYIIGEQVNDSIISIYYSQQRIISKKYNSITERDDLYGSKSALKIDINKDGSIVSKITDFSSECFNLYSSNFIATNHDIFRNNIVAFRRNHGYEYDSSQEGDKTCNDIMKVTADTKVYEKAGINYNEISTLSSDNVVRRIAYSVNTSYGHTWDKIVLSDGTEGYVFAECLEKATEYENISFEYKDKTYDIYFSVSKYGINLKDYPYYVIGEQVNDSIISIYYSQQRIISKKYNSITERDDLYGSKSALKIDINKDGSIASKVTNFSSECFNLYSSNFIATNHDIFRNNSMIYSKNCGPEYDLSFIENGNACNDIIKVLYNATNVYPNVRISGSKIATLSSGDIVTRIAYSVATICGYKIDKIRLSDGTEGYVLANRLEVLKDIVIGTYDGETTEFSSSMTVDDIATVQEELSEIILSEEEAGQYIYAENLTDFIINNELLTDIKAIAHDGAVICAYSDELLLQDAGENLLYYLTKGKSGKVYGDEIPYTENPYKEGHIRREFIGLNLIADSDQAYNRMKKEIGKAIDAAQKYASLGNNTISFVSTQEHIVRIPGQNDDSVNWLLALGEYRVFTEASVTKNGDTYTMDIAYHIEDYYDWREEDEVYTLKTIASMLFSGDMNEIFVAASCPLWQMNIVGMARNYTNYDILNLKVTWQEGQNVDSGAKFVFN